MAAVEQVKSAIADGTGVAAVILDGPGTGRVDLDSIVVNVSGSTTVPVCTVYDGTTPTLGRTRASTRLGDKTTFVSTGDVLYAGQAFFVQWTGVTPGVACVAILRGVAS